MLRKFAGLVLGVLLVTCGIAHAQQSASSGIQGIVTDSSGAAVPGATVTVTNIGTNAERVTVTDPAGRFSVPNLLPARYRVHVELQGFQAAEVSDLELRDGETARPTLTLAVGGVSEAVSVQAESPLLQTQSASVGQTIGEKQIEALPLSGRSVLSAASLAAGVTPRAFQRGTQYGRRNEYITVEGGRDSSTNYAIDGVYVRSLRFNNMSLNPPLDAVQQVTLLRNSFSTEYGQGQAVVSMVTKSGSNSLSGSVYEFVRNDAFDSKNFFATSKTPYDRNQFGVTGGGPIVRNKIFFFGGYEGLRTTQGQTFLASVASPTQLSGNFSALATPILDPTTGQPFPGNIIPTSRFSTFAKVLGPTVPAPNNTGSTNYRVVKNFIDDADSVVLRSDQTLNTKHSLFERYLWADGTQISPGAFTATNLPQKGKNLAIGETWVMAPTWVN
ncbi:MAG TPA: carboxypeptidase-like regulatory domain-containing protein, partial [Vicinamibacterales bacterium]